MRMKPSCSRQICAETCRSALNIRNYLLRVLDEGMKNYVRNCTQTWVRVSKFAHAHEHVSQKVAHMHVFLQWTLSFESVKPMFSDIVSCAKSWIQRRFRNLNSSGGMSFRLQMWVVRWKRWCHMPNVTHRHIYVSQKSVQTLVLYRANMRMNASRRRHICVETW